MKRNVLSVLLCIACVSFLSACGGGGSGSGSATTATSPSVNAVTSESVMYKKSATITVSGENLDKGISATASGACTSLTEQPGGTSASRSYSCVPSSIGPLNVTISTTTGGTVLKQANVTVPLPQVTLVTSKGTIVLELRPDKAPITVDNFLQYVNDGFYTNTYFHRVVRGFVVQGGGYSVDQPLALKTTRAAITLEPPSATGLSNTVGTIAMARSTDLNSATSQFFFNTVNNTGLDAGSGGYAVFGSVIQGMNVVRLIDSVAVDSNSKPTTMVTVTSASQTNAVTVSLPPAPTGVSATGETNKITLSWNDVPEAVSYNAYASRTSGVTTTNGTKITNLTSPIAFQALLANTTYYWIITAVNSAGESAPSAQVSATTAQLDGGIALYNDNCASCHGALATLTSSGSIRKKTATQIKTAITSVAEMKAVSTLTSLTSVQIQTIANTLNF